MRLVIALVLSLAFVTTAAASYDPVRPLKRPDIEIKIEPSDILVEVVNDSSPLIPYSLKLWRFQKLLSLIMLGTKAPVWDINYPLSMKLLKQNDDLNEQLGPASRSKKICLFCNHPENAK